jgi:predicted ester cyclase
MSPAEVARMVFEEGWTHREFDTVRPHLADEFDLHVGGATHPTTVADFEVIVDTWHAAFPDLRFDIHMIIEDDDVAAVYATLRGTHLGPWRGLAPTGRSIAVEHAFFLRVLDGIVVEVWEILDRSALVGRLTETP